MTPLISAQGISKSHGAQVLFEDLSLSLCAGERIGLIGPNGAGKTSLLKILAGVEPPDSGSISKKQHLRIGYASQTPEFPSEPIEQFLVDQPSHGDLHERHVRARILLGKAEFDDFHANAATLSGGWKKRLDLARALMDDPEFLFLDEPTNHLDLEGILWLEQFLRRIDIPFLLISHDRYFLENCAEKILELNKCYPEGLFLCKGNMSAFTQQKEEYLSSLEKQKRGLAHKVREETQWLNTSPKARTTKSQSRIDQAHRLIDELTGVTQRSKQHTAGIEFTASERETRKLLVAKNLAKSLGGKALFQNLDLTLSPGSCLGIVGNNGTGKTTLLKILSGAVSHDCGTIKYAEDLKLVYFDQHREQIPAHLTLKEALCPSGDTVTYQGRPIHVNGWAKRFLFPPEKLNLPVGFLSGGERARILIAKLMLQPADILFLDEPTNDLDIPTLEVIEEGLSTFPGAVILISHDRCLMDRLCTQIIGFPGNASHQFFAGYDQWERFCATQKKGLAKEKMRSSDSEKKTVKKLSYQEKKELETMEEKIMELEQAIEALNQAALEAAHLDHYAKLGKMQEQLEALYARWQDLLSRSENH